MSAGAKVSVVGLLLVAALGWGLVATTPSIERPVPSAQPADPEPEHAPAPEPEPGPAPTREAVAAPKPRPEPAATPQPATPPAPGADQDPERGRTEDEDPGAAAEAERDRDFERHAARYDAARGRFASEPRDEAWASEQERTLRGLVEEATPGELLEGVACKTSMCEVRVHFDALVARGGIQRLGPLARALGSERAVRHEGPPGQRTMVVYTPRDGHWPDAPTEDPTPNAP